MDGSRAPCPAPRCGGRRRRSSSPAACSSGRLADPGAEHCGDEAEAVERLGLRPRLVLGSERNLKITVPEDLELAALVLAAQEGG
ncbi:MAG: 2-C-methyl-D-erythritol 4-phosphate cytidylyltransferase [Xanthomonadales bacterium]|nr:2-C-methyl-D-erythritol 4-phosphate cytidylyltransferase [Xanthomonadales bacterium]